MTNFISSHWTSRNPNAHLANDPTAVKPLPHSDDAENLVLGCLIADSRCSHIVRSIIDYEDLYRPTSRHIWRAIHELITEKCEVDVMTVADRLHARGHLMAVGGPAQLMRLYTDVVSVVNVDHWCNIVKRESTRRQVIAQAEHIKDLAYDAGEDVSELLAKAQRNMDKIVRASVRSNGEQIQGQLKGWRDEFMQRSSGVTPLAYSTGIPALDKVLKGGLKPNRATLIAGYQKSGKSKSAMQLAAWLAREHGAVVEHYATEMVAFDLITRLVSHEARVEESWLTDPTSVGAAGLGSLMGAVERAQERVSEYTVDWRIYTNPAPKLSEIIATTQTRVNQIAGKRPIVLLIDYVQEIDSGAKPGSDAKRINAEIAAPQLAALCNQHNVIGIFVAHLNRPDKKVTKLVPPTQDDVFGSAAWAKAVDHLITIWMPFADEEPSETSDHERERQQYTQWRMGRSRHNAPGNVHLRADLGCNFYEPWRGQLPDLSAPVKRSDY